jgi:serine/threonine-protein kinase
MGLLRSDNAPAGHRIYVDDRVVGETGSTPIAVKCGVHAVKVGSSGYRRTVDVPCGGELTLER